MRIQILKTLLLMLLLMSLKGYGQSILIQNADFKRFAETFFTALAESNYEQYQKAIWYDSEGKPLLGSDISLLRIKEEIAQGRQLPMYYAVVKAAIEVDKFKINDFDIKSADFKEAILDNIPQKEHKHISECKVMSIISKFDFWAVRYKGKWFYLRLMVDGADEIGNDK